MIMIQDLEKIMFGYMINTHDFSIKPEMFDSKQIQLYIKMLS